MLGAAGTASCAVGLGTGVVALCRGPLAGACLGGSRAGGTASGAAARGCGPSPGVLGSPAGGAGGTTFATAVPGVGAGVASAVGDFGGVRLSWAGGSVAGGTICDTGACLGGGGVGATTFGTMAGDCLGTGADSAFPWASCAGAEGPGGATFASAATGSGAGVLGSPPRGP